MRRGPMTRYLSAVFLLVACPSGSSQHDPHPTQSPPTRIAEEERNKGVALTSDADVPAARCTPCRLQIRHDEPSREIRADLAPSQKRIIVQTASSKSPQILPVEEPLDSPDAWALGTDDINFDGYADLYMVTTQGSVNEYARYFRYIPEQHAFGDIGRFPVFKLNRSKRRLSTYVKNGSAGLDYESAEYAIVDGQPVLVRQEQQSVTDDPDVFRYTVRELIAGELKVVAEKQVQAPPPD